MVAEPFAPHPYVVVANTRHRLVGKRRIPMDSLLGEPFIVRERGSDTWNSMEDGFGDRVDKLNVVMQIKSTETIKQAVIAGMGLSFLSVHTLSRELKARELAVLDVRGLPLMLNWYVVHRAGKRLPPVAEAFKSFLLEEGAGLVERALAGGRRGRVRTLER